MVVFRRVGAVGKQHGHPNAAFILRFVVPVPHFLFRLPKLHGRKRVFPGQFQGVVANAVVVIKLGFGKTARLLFTAEQERHPVVDHSLPPQHIEVIRFGHMNIGKYIQPGEALCEVIDKSAPLLCLTTYEKDLADMKVGSPVQFRVNGMGKTVFKATLVSIGQKVDEVSRSLEVYARIDDVNQQFRPGMYVTARIQK